MMVAILWIGAIAVCCGLCAYGINVAVRRGKGSARGAGARAALIPAPGSAAAHPGTRRRTRVRGRAGP
jgi:hypothetical protein